MVGVDGRVRVLDFGLSRGRGVGPRSQIAITRRNLADIGVTAAGSMLGTPAYMSPEQFRGDEADARSDQFGFCAAVWEGFYGRRPFSGGDVRELRTNVLAGKLVAPPADTHAEVLLLFGDVTGSTLHGVEALKPLERAELLALEAGADAVAAAAISTWISNAGFGAGRPADALAAGPRAWALVRRVGSPPVLAARLHHAIASVRFELGDADGSIAEYESALALLTRPGDLDRVSIVHDLVLTRCVAGRLDQARELGEAELARMVESHGACHPDTAALRLALAQCETGGGRVEQALDHAEQSFVCLADTAPQLALRALSLVIGLLYQRNELAQVRRRLERADPLLARVGDDPVLRVTFDMYRAQLAISDGHTAEAGRMLGALNAQLAADDGAKEYRALVESLLCKLALAEHDPTRALVHASRADALLPPSAPPQYRASLRFAHARALRAINDRAGSVAGAEEAIADYEAAGPGFAAKADEIRRWLADPDAP